jgi:hypothetical protein
MVPLGCSFVLEADKLGLGCGLVGVSGGAWLLAKQRNQLR